MLKENIKKAKNWIEKSDAILITAGAGMGVDSGLPDFRGKEGFWRAYPPLKKLNINFEEMANPMWFEENPKLAWAFYGHRLNLYRKTKIIKPQYTMIKIYDNFVIAQQKNKKNFVKLF